MYVHVAIVMRMSSYVRLFTLQTQQHICESACPLPMCPRFDSRTRRHMRVEFVVGSLLCSERFFSGYYTFPLSSKTNISKFQFDAQPCLSEFFELLGAPPRVNKLHLHLHFTFFLCPHISALMSILRHYGASLK